MRKKNGKEKLQDEDLIPTRQKVREFSEGQFVTILMACVTLFALFGDDFRLWFTTKKADIFIDSALIFSLIAFTAEILVNSCVVDEFKYSFFFWLDIIATCSICVDVSILWNFVGLLFGEEPESADAQMGELAVQEAAGNKIGKLVKALRLIRLIRIIKLYKYVVKSGSDIEEARMREQTKIAGNAQQAALNRELEPSRLGRSLSEALTRRLIILVLVLLMALPAITHSSFDVSHQYGIRQLFWFGRSNCKDIVGEFECNEEQWMSQDGWNEKVRSFVQAASTTESDVPSKEVLWIHVPDFTRNGVVGDIRNVTHRESDYNPLWLSLDTIEDRYTALAIEPIKAELSQHRDLFTSTYESLTEAQKTRFSQLNRDLLKVNLYEKAQIYKLLEAGIDVDSYEALLQSHSKVVNGTLSSPLKQDKEAGDQVALKYIYKEREYFRTLDWDHDDISDWLLSAANQTLVTIGMSEDLTEQFLQNYENLLETLHIGGKFDFFTLLFGNDDFKSLEEWEYQLTWARAIPLQWLKRNWFVDELYWLEDKHCSGFNIDHDPKCDLRAKEMKLLTYTPTECLTPDSGYEGCDRLVSYARISIKSVKEGEAALQFATTIFTCIILGAGAIMFANDTQELVINPITKMVGIIKTLADDPLQKPEAPQFDDEDDNQQKGQMKTIQLQKTIFRIGNLLQMSFGQLGAIIIREQVSSGDGNLEIMIPGQKINAIFMICKINQFVDYTEVLKTNLTDFLNRITTIVHQCAYRWDGWANSQEGDRYVITWKIPDIEESKNDSERSEALQEQRTELADESLITAIKIVSEIRRANQFNVYFRKNQMVQRFGSKTRPFLTFGLHLGSSIQGAIGSDNKIDACYLSPNLKIACRLEQLTKVYDMQILLSEPLYSFMSLKARNTLRKIDVVLMDTFINPNLQTTQEPMGLYTFDMSFNNAEISTISEDHEVGDLIKLTQYETINIENFKNKGVDYMFTLDSDIVGLQQHIMEFNPIFRQAFKTYISGDWGQAYEQIERCLELWENDGPTKALQQFMQCYQYNVPNDWSNCRNIDQEINFDEINNQFGVDNIDDDESEKSNKKNEESKKQQ